MTNKQDVEKARYWQAVIREAARSGMSKRAFSRQRKLKECQFYWWQRRLKQQRPPASTPPGSASGAASFALVSDEAGTFEFPFAQTGRREIAAWELGVPLEGTDLSKGRRRAMDDSACSVSGAAVLMAE